MPLNSLTARSLSSVRTSESILAYGYLSTSDSAISSSSIMSVVSFSSVHAAILFRIRAVPCESSLFIFSALNIPLTFFRECISSAAFAACFLKRRMILAPELFLKYFFISVLTIAMPHKADKAVHMLTDAAITSILFM